MFATIATVAVPIVIILFVFLFIANMYVRCGSEEILVVSGKLFGKDITIGLQNREIPGI